MLLTLRFFFYYFLKIKNDFALFVIVNMLFLKISFLISMIVFEIFFFLEIDLHFIFRNFLNFFISAIVIIFILFLSINIIIFFFSINIFVLITIFKRD